MNDTELDEMLDRWQVAVPSPDLRENVRAGFVAEHSTVAVRPSRRWWRRPSLRGRRFQFAAGLAGIAVLFLGITQALPQTIQLASPFVRVPFTVESEFVRSSEDGQTRNVFRIVSYANQFGDEIVLSSSFPGSPWRTAFRRTLDTVGFMLGQLAEPFRDKTERNRRAAITAERIRNGCAMAGKVVGHETILNYQTTVLELNMANGGQTTLWMAPDLGCYVLRLVSEERRPDGKLLNVVTRQALRVNANP